MPTHTALRFNLRAAASSNSNADEQKTSAAQVAGSNASGGNFSVLPAFEEYSVNQSDDFSVQSVNGLGAITSRQQSSSNRLRILDNGSPMNHPGDISSTVALASFCSNSINGSAILQSHDNYNSTR